RSGTTLLRTLFDVHKNVIIPLEAPFMMLFYFKYNSKKNWSENDILGFYNDIVSPHTMEFLSIKNWNLDKEGLKKDLLSCKGKTSFAELCRIVNASYPSIINKKEIMLIGDKNPAYSNRTNYLLKLYPDAKFIHLTRDYRDHIQSLQKVDFGKGVIPLQAHYWKKSVKLNQKLQKKYPDQFFFIRYEDFVQKPAKHLKAMCDFLEIEHLPEVLEFHKYKDEAKDKYKHSDLMKYHSSLFKPIDSRNVGDWKKRLTSQQIEFAEIIAGKTGEKIGYKRSVENIKFSSRLKVLPLIFYAKTTDFLGKFVKLLPYNTMRRIIDRGPVLGKLYWKFFSKK
ncbi:MAG: sulfotransferase, partial [Bacteroidota bacterium]|nr:sulfotransferase [Bacteroidota bacterium]